MLIAAYQCRAMTGDVAGNLRRLDQIACSAACAGAEILVLPELYLTGYALGDRLEALAFATDAPALCEVSAIAKRHGLSIALGYPQRLDNGVANMAALWDSSGHLIVRYQKINLFGEAENRAFVCGSDLNISPLTTRQSVVNVGLLICYDMEKAATVSAITDRGCELILAPTANMEPYRNAALVSVRARALETATSLVYANYVGNEGSLTYTGLSAIIGPDGEDLARAGSQGEALLIAEVPEP
jgi:predicted amidohydrolase